MYSYDGKAEFSASLP